jgi:hypothetical protein
MMLHFMVEALQDPPVCSSTDLCTNGVGGNKQRREKFTKKLNRRFFVVHTVAQMYSTLGDEKVFF